MEHIKSLGKIVSNICLRAHIVDEVSGIYYQGGGPKGFFRVKPPGTKFLVDGIYQKTLKIKILVFWAKSAYRGHFF